MAKPMLVAKRRRTEVTAADQQSVAPPPRRPQLQAAPPPPMLSDSERYAQIRLCAYFRAEQRGFAPGHMWDDWLAAEQEVAARNARAPSNHNDEKKT
jgi:hypothetical protein